MFVKIAIRRFAQYNSKGQPKQYAKTESITDFVNQIKATSGKNSLAQSCVDALSEVTGDQVTDRASAKYISQLGGALLKLDFSLYHKDLDFWQKYQQLIQKRQDSLSHPVAPTKVAFALSQVHHSVPLNKHLIQQINQLTLKNRTKLNHIDLFMFVRYLNSQSVKEICNGHTEPFLDLSNVWPKVLDQVTKQVPELDQNNLAILAKTVSTHQFASTQEFWQAVNRRFIELEHELNLQNFSFIVFGFVQAQVLDESNFLRLSRKALLRNIDLWNWKDIPMILTVADRLDFEQVKESKEFAAFWEVVAECTNQLLTQAQEDHTQVSYQSFMITLFAVCRNCIPREDHLDLWTKIDLTIPLLDKQELIRNKSALFKLITVYTAQQRSKRVIKTEAAKLACDFLIELAVISLKQQLELQKEGKTTQFFLHDATTTLGLLPSLTQDQANKAHIELVIQILTSNHSQMTDADRKYTLMGTKELLLQPSLFVSHESLNALNELIK